MKDECLEPPIAFADPQRFIETEDQAEKAQFLEAYQAKHKNPHVRLQDIRSSMARAKKHMRGDDRKKRLAELSAQETELLNIIGPHKNSVQQEPEVPVHRRKVTRTRIAERSTIKRRRKGEPVRSY